MELEYARHYRSLYERHWWWRARERFLLETLSRWRPAKGWGAILDVGCGDGLMFDRLSELGDVEGVEADPSIVSETGKHRARIQVRPFDASFQPGKRYSLILMLDVIEHLSDPGGALRHAVTLLEPGGVLVATVPAFLLLWTTHDVLNHHFTRYTKRSFGTLARSAGLRVVRAGYFFHWIYPAKLLVRLREAIVHPHPSPPRVPPRWMNELLYLGSRLEQKLVTPLGVPFGSSLLVVARPANVA
ncbi:MAG TPA: class I SAM-dependent methyltransferase [Gemmatimonadales bacterium]|nr:class I SAM-dependent methyltransferase [Gemmatimonadales bacterium]